MVGQVIFDEGEAFRFSKSRTYKNDQVVKSIFENDFYASAKDLKRAWLVELQYTNSTSWFYIRREQTVHVSNIQALSAFLQLDQ